MTKASSNPFSVLPSERSNPVHASLLRFPLSPHLILFSGMVSDSFLLDSSSSVAVSGVWTIASAFELRVSLENAEGKMDSPERSSSSLIRLHSSDPLLDFDFPPPPKGWEGFRNSDSATETELSSGRKLRNPTPSSNRVHRIVSLPRAGITSSCQDSPEDVQSITNSDDGSEGRKWERKDQRLSEYPLTESSKLGSALKSNSVSTIRGFWAVWIALASIQLSFCEVIQSSIRPSVHPFNHD